MVIIGLKRGAAPRGGIALSSAEAEYYAIVEAATRALGIKNLAEDIDMHMKVVLHTDSSSAKSMSSRRGVGRMRHIEAKWLWLQSAVADGRIKIFKIPGSKNPADLFTKFLSIKSIQDLLNRCGCELWSSSQEGV